MNKPRSKKRQALYWVILILFFTIVPLVLLETGARVYIHFKHGVPGKSYGLWCYDAELGAVHCKNAYNTNTITNNEGFRNTEDVIAPKPEGAYRVISYGGSTTFCYNLLNDETWSFELEKHLRLHHHPKDQVLNGGAIMWSLGHAFAKAKRDLPELKPDYVIIYSGINEEANAQYLEMEGLAMKTLVEKGDYGRFTTSLDQNRWVKRNLTLVRLIDYVVAPFFSKKLEEEKKLNVYIPTEPDPYILENYLHTLTAFVQLIKAQGATPIFLVQTHGRNNKINVRMTSYSRHGAAAAAEAGAIVINADEIVLNYKGHPMDLFHDSGVHYSKLGAQLLGEFIYQKAFAPQDSTTENHEQEPRTLKATLEGADKE